MFREESRDFTLLWVGQAASQFGSGLYAFGYTLWVLQRYDSIAAIGLVTAATLTSFTAAQVPAGWLADRFDRRKVLLACDASSCLAALGLAAGARTGVMGFALLMLTAVALGAGAATRRIAEGAALTNVVPEERLPQAISLNEARGYAAALAAPAVAGWLFTLDAGLPFLVDGLTYLFSIACALAVRVPLQGQQATDSRPTVTRTDYTAGVRLFWRQPFIRTASLLSAATDYAVAGFALVAAVLLLERAAVAPSVAGLAAGAASAVGLAGAMATPWIRRHTRTVRRALYVSSVGTIASMLVMSLSLSPGAGAPVVSVVVVGYASLFLLRPLWQAAVARRITLVEDRFRGRVQAVMGLVAAVPFTLAPVTTGLAIDAWGLPAACAGLLTIMVLAAIGACVSRAVHAVDQTVAVTAARAVG
jgi:MFS family permease